MSIPKTLIRQRDFSAGEVDPIAERRSDTDIHERALKVARNVRPRDVGGVTRRSGRRIVYVDGGYHDLVRPVSSAVFDVTFDVGRFTARLNGGGVVASILGCPWTAAILPNLSWIPIGRRIYVAARGMRPHFVEYDPDSGLWGLFAYEFQSGANGRWYAPFHRFADLGVTMRPSARTGNIQLTASDDVFVAGHVGTRFTYVGRQVEITAVTNAQLANARVIEELPPTFRLNLDSTEGFAAGETIEGDDSNTIAEVVKVNSGSSIEVVVSNNYGGFDANEYVVSATGRAKVTSQTTIAAGASLQWREQFMSDLRGWPGSVAYEYQRLIFCDFPQFEEAIIASAIGAEQDLETTNGAADAAIFSYVPKTCRVYQVIGGSDLFILTDAGCFFVPVSESTPFTGSNTRFKFIASTAAANVHAVAADDAIVFVGAEARRLFGIVPTGQQAQPYRVLPLSDFHSHLFTNPISIAVADGSAAAPGRHLYVVNQGGDVVVGRYEPGADYVGWFPWTSQGQVTAVAARYGSVLFSVRYDGTDVVEAIDDGFRMDGSIRLSDFVGNDAIETSTGEAITTTTEENLVTSAGALIPFAGTTMFGWGDGFFLGPVEVDASGFVDFPVGFEDRVLGWPFTPEVVPFVRTFEGGEAYGQAVRRRKVSRVVLTVRDTTTFIADGRQMGREFASYDVGDNMEEPRPLRDETYRYRTLGRSFDPEITISQPVPGDFTLIEIALEVTI